MLSLVRGWERKFLPKLTGELCLSKVNMYRDADESSGVGDGREGEIRTSEDLNAKIGLREALREAGLDTLASEEILTAFEEETVRGLYADTDDPNIEFISEGDGQYLVKAHPKVDSTSGRGMHAPYAICMSREPTTKSEWAALQDSLPEEYDAWTRTADISSLKFEIECGIKRWLALNDISEHRMQTMQGWVAYEYDLAPEGSEPVDIPRLIMGERWFRKSKRYQAQNEYRLLWEITSSQIQELPDRIVIELTKTGISLFQSWSPPLS